MPTTIFCQADGVLSIQSTHAGQQIPSAYAPLSPTDMLFGAEVLPRWVIFKWLHKCWGPCQNRFMNEEEMIQAIQAGGRQQELALRALYQKAAEFRRYFVYKFRVSAPEAEDLVQDTIVKIFRGASSYSGGKGFGQASANSWMWTIARNIATDFTRKQITRKMVQCADVSNAPSYDADHVEVSDKYSDNEPLDSSADAYQLGNTRTSQECVGLGLEQFAAEHPDRSLVLEMQLDGEDIASIARRIERTVAATKEYLSQCRKKLSLYIAHCTELLTP